MGRKVGKQWRYVMCGCTWLLPGASGPCQPCQSVIVVRVGFQGSGIGHTRSDELLLNHMNQVEISVHE